MTSEGLGKMFEGDSADTCGGKFPLVSMGGRAEGLACADTGARTPIGASGNFPTQPKSNVISDTEFFIILPRAKNVNLLASMILPYLE
jgi:hypothetical protein